jgi:hypothetical protein
MDTLSQPGKVNLPNILQSPPLLYLESPVASPGMHIISDILPEHRFPAERPKNILSPNKFRYVEAQDGNRQPRAGCVIGTVWDRERDLSAAI